MVKGLNPEDDYEVFSNYNDEIYIHIAKMTDNSSGYKWCGSMITHECDNITYSIQLSADFLTKLANALGLFRAKCIADVLVNYKDDFVYYIDDEECDFEDPTGNRCNCHGAPCVCREGYYNTRSYISGKYYNRLVKLIVDRECAE